MASYNTRWSFSALQTFENCKYKYFRTKVSKDVKEVYSDERKNGISFHAAAEEFMKSGGKVMDIAYVQHKATLEGLLSIARTCEHKEYEKDLAIKNDWTPTEFSYKSGLMWTAAKPDVLFVKGKTALLFDYKLGKVRNDTDQLKLYASIVFSHYPEVTAIKSTYLFLAHNKKIDEVIQRDKNKHIQEEFTNRVINIYKAHDAAEWTKEPNPLCGWCPVKDCEHNKG